MPVVKGQAGASLSIGQYSQLVLQKYITHQFSPDGQENLKIAAEELYVLLHRLRSAASKDSEDSKAPLKAIRNAVEHFVFHGSRGADSSEVEALLQLYAALEECCDERMRAGGSECEGVLQVQDALRYRMTRLVTGDAWDARPQLKLRVLKLMFRFMARENDRILASSRSLGVHGREVPPRISRQSSFGKRAVAVPTAPFNRWSEAINEMSKMQGSRMLPLLKLAMLENLELGEAAGATLTPTAGAPAAATTPHHFGEASVADATGAGAPSGSSPAGSEGGGSTDGGAGWTARAVTVGVMPASPSTPAQTGKLRELLPAQPASPAMAGVDDLLGLFDEPSPPPQEDRPQPSPSSTSSGPGPPAEQLFATFGSTPGSAGSSSGSGNPFLFISSAVQPQAAGSHWRHQPSQAPPPGSAVGQLSALSISGSQPAVQPTDTGIAWQCSHRSPPPPQQRDSAPGQGAFSAPAGSGGAWGFLQGQLQSQGSGSELYRHNSNPLFDQPFDQAPSPKQEPSPYLQGKANPFGDTRFSDIAPPLQALRPPPPPPPPAGPPMRTPSFK